MTAPAEDLVLVGTIERPHGLRGEVVVHPLTDFPEARFTPGASLLTARAGQVPGAGARALRIEDVRWHKGRPLVLFADVETVEGAETLRGLGLFIAAAARPALERGLFYETDLVGCRVETAAGEPVGEVRRIDGAPGASVLVIDGRSEHGEVLVPLAEDICRIIDPAARRIVIEPPAGLLELNAPSPVPRAARRGRRRRTP